MVARPQTETIPFSSAGWASTYGNTCSPRCGKYDSAELWGVQVPLVWQLRDWEHVMHTRNAKMQARQQDARAKLAASDPKHTLSSNSPDHIEHELILGDVSL